MQFNTLRNGLFICLILVHTMFGFENSSADELQKNQESKEPTANIESNHKFQYMGELGTAMNSYNSSTTSIFQTSILAKLGVSYRYKNWNRIVFSLGGFYTLIPLNYSDYSFQGSNEKVKIRYLGLNARIGWDTPWLKNQWSMQMNLGWYYNTTFVTNDRFGYVNANGPQLFPVVEYRINPDSKVGGFVKFSPLSVGFSFLDSEFNYELAAGAYYVFPGMIFEKYKYSVNLDYAHLSIKPNSIRAYSNSTTLGFGILL